MATDEVGYSAGGPVVNAASQGTPLSRPAAFASGVGSGSAPANPLGNVPSMTSALLPSPNVSGAQFSGSSNAKSNGGGLLGDIGHAFDDVAKPVARTVLNNPVGRLAVKGGLDAVADTGIEAIGLGPEDPLADAGAVGADYAINRGVNGLRNWANSK